MINKWKTIKTTGFGIMLLIVLYIEFKWNLFAALIVALGGMYTYTKLPIYCKSKYQKILIEGISIFFSILFVFNLSGFSIAQWKDKDTTTNILIKVLGEKNPDALGTEVWLVEIDRDYEKISLLEGEFDNNWEYREPRIVTYNGEDAYYECVLPIKSNVKIIFAKGEYSGKVRVDINGKENSLDLYSKEGGFATVEYFYPIYKISILYAIIVFGLIYLFIKQISLFISYMWHNKDKNNVYLYYAVITGSAASLYWLSYYPGSMTADSMTQWKQMIGVMPLTTQHSVFYILISWLLTRVWFDPAIIIIAQIVSYVFIYSHIFACFDEKIGRKKVTIIACIVAFYFLNNLTVITLWKDIPYTLALMELTFILIRVFCYGASFKDKKIFLGFVISCIFVLAFRHNGKIPIYGTLLALTIICIKQRKSIIRAILVIICFMAILTGPVYKVLEVKTAGNQMKLGYAALTDIGYLIYNDVAFTEEEQHFFDNILLSEIWKQNYRSYDVNSVYFHDDLNKEFLLDNQNEFYKIWFKYSLKYPYHYMRSNLSRTSLVWNIFDVGDNTAVYAGGGILGSEYCPEIYETSKLPNLRRIIDQFAVNGIMHISWLGSLFSRPALFMYFALCIWWRLRKSKKNLWIVFVPNFLNILSITISTPSQEVRFLWPNVVLIPLFLLLYLDRQKWRE